jgi:hypothetical protein
MAIVTTPAGNSWSNQVKVSQGHPEALEPAETRNFQSHVWTASRFSLKTVKNETRRAAGASDWTYIGYIYERNVRILKLPLN